MKKVTKFIAFIALIGWFSSGAVSAQNYKTCSENKIKNPTFDKNSMWSTTVDDWTFNPAGNRWWGWRQDVSLIYGNTLWIDRRNGTNAGPDDIYTASSNLMTLCANGAKLLKFSFSSSNTYKYELQVKLAGVLIGTFIQPEGAAVGLAQSLFTPAPGISEYSIVYNFWPVHNVTDNKVNNNIWHDFAIYIPANKIAATSGTLEFVYRKIDVSRQVYIDNVEVYETIPTPVPTSTSAIIDCSKGQTTFNLNTLLPAANPVYTYKWYADATQTTAVANPTAVKPGYYYLFATSTCAGSACTSRASLPVRVFTQNCCESNLVTNGSFSNVTTSGNNPNGGPLASTPRLTDADPWSFNENELYAITVHDLLGGKKVLAMDPTSGGTVASFWQSVKVCPGDNINISMSIGMVRNAAGGQNRKVGVTLDGATLLSLNAYSTGGLKPNSINITIVDVNELVSDIKVGGEPYYQGQVLAGEELHKLSFKYNVPTSSITPANFSFEVGQGSVAYIDDVVIQSAGIVARAPKRSQVYIACDQETADITKEQPGANSLFKYQWHTAATIGSPLVEDPKRVGAGTYYLETISTCSGCPAAEYKPIEVIKNACPTISGKLYSDYDGAANGINNNPERGFSGGGLFVLLVNSAGNVVKTQKIADDGSFSFSATAGTYKLMLSYTEVAVGVAAPATATLRANYMFTGEGVGSGTINSDGTPNGIINNISLGSSGTTTAAFGINAAPIAAGSTREECFDTKPATFTIPTLTGYDDGKDWQNGVNQKIIIKKLTSLIEGAEVQTSNGTLKYDGAAITSVPFTIDSYDPAKLLFELGQNAQPYRALFEYVFVDAAGQESLVPAVVDYRMNVKPTITTGPLASQIICNDINPQQLNVAAEGTALTYKWYSNTTNSNSGGTAIATATAATYTPPTNTIGTFYYYATVTNGCGTVTSNVSKVTVQGASTPFSPNVFPTSEICARNEGQLKITVPSGGTAPFTYKITEGATTPEPVTTMDREYSFTNLAPGTYHITVTDVCGNTQARGPYTLNKGNSSAPGIYAVMANESTECGFTDYYLVPGSGDLYPHIYYAYPNGDLNATPITITVNGREELKPIPHSDRSGFLMRLKQTSPFVAGTAYTFKMTNACYTDVATVAAKTAGTGDFKTEQLIQECKNSLQVTLGGGWHQPVTVKLVAISGGMPSREQTIDAGSNSTIFENIASGEYTATLTDKCGNSNNQRVVVTAPDMNVDINPFCGSNIDGLSGFQVVPKSGWRYPIKVTFLEGPTNHQSPLSNETITVTYPVTFNPDGGENDNIVRMRNIKPGAYKLRIEDGCTTKEVDYNLPGTSNVEQYTVAPLEWRGCPGTQDIVIDHTAKCGSLSVIVYQKTGEKTWSLKANGIHGNTYRAQPGTYRVFYVKDIQKNELFVSGKKLVSTSEYTLNSQFDTKIWFTYQDIVVPTISTQPTVGAYVLGECNGNIHVRFQGSSNSAKLIGYRIETVPGSNVYTDYQTSNRFVLRQYGHYQYSVKDECGNEYTSSVNIDKHVPPVFTSDCNDDGSMKLTASRRPVSEGTPNSKYKWTLPNNSVVEGDVLELGANRAAGVYKLTSTHTVYQDDGTTVICAEEHTTDFWVPEPSKQFLPGLLTTYNAAVSMPFNPEVPDTYKNRAQIKWYKGNTEIAGATGWSINVTQSGLYTMQVTYPPLSCLFEYKQQVTLKNYWMGGTTGSQNSWATADNWTAKYVPRTLPGQTEPVEDVEFATVANFGTAAKEDLHLDQDRVVNNLMNASDKNLLVTVGNQLTIKEKVTDGNATAGNIIVKADPDKATGTLLFAKPTENTDLPAVVEFYNKGYDCATCGFYTRKWQYFGIPVQQSPFPYSNPKVETVNQWVESFKGDKWRPAPYAPDTELKAFKGYEITNSSKTPPATIYKFSGKLNLTDASVALTKTGGVNYSGMNLVANSYTAAIPIKETALKFSSPLANKTVYLFNAGTRDHWRRLNGSRVTHDTRSGQYKAVPINVAGAAGLPGIIPSMHTFMLQADAANRLTIQYDQLTKNATVDGMAWRAAATTSRREYPYIVMDIIGAQSADRVWLFENPATTRGFDNGWDGFKIPEKGVAQLYVLGDNGTKYQVASVPDMLGTSFGFAADADHHYSVSFSVTAEVESRQLYLQDLRTRQFIPIRNGVEATILGQKGYSGHRFRVVAKTAIANILSSVEIIANKRIIYIVNHSDENCTAYVYDLTGRLAAQRPVKPKSTERIGMTMQGVYVVKVIGQTVNEAKRVMVE